MAKVFSTKDNLQVLYQDNHIIVINKRVGDIVQGDKTGDTPLSEIVKQYLKEKYNKPGEVFLGVVHRLDRPTSGIVVFARTSKALARLNEQFKSRISQKTYWALVSGKPDPETATLVHFMKRNPVNNTSKAHKNVVPDSKEARLSYQVLKVLDRYSFVEVNLETGRHHQIRSQFSAIGHPVKGDLKYGAARSNPDGGIDLHSRKLIIEHPVQKTLLTFTADPPNGIWPAL